MAAATFSHIPAVFAPAGPMTSGLANDAKSEVRMRFAAGEAGREELLKAEMAAYHGPGTCTFYGTANSNQMLMEFMGLHLPGASFVNPGTPLREALTRAAAAQALANARRNTNGANGTSHAFTPVSAVLDERAFANGIVGLLATGGSTNLLLHLPAMARAAGIRLLPADFAELSEAVPLLARIYPNGLADVNQFHAAGGLAFTIRELLQAGLLHPDTRTVAGTGLAAYTQEPVLAGNGGLSWRPGPEHSLATDILRPVADPFSPQGGLRLLSGDLGEAVVKTSAVGQEHRTIRAEARVFHGQDAVRRAFQQGELNRDCVVVVRFQGPRANGMPELHGLTPLLSVLQQRGHRVALVTDGRMSGASGRVPAAIHVSPEAAAGGPIAKLADGDLLQLDATEGRLDVLAPEDWQTRPPVQADLSGTEHGTGRELFHAFRRLVGPAEEGAAVAV